MKKTHKRIVAVALIAVMMFASSSLVYASGIDIGGFSSGYNYTGGSGSGDHYRG